MEKFLTFLQEKGYVQVSAFLLEPKYLGYHCGDNYSVLYTTIGQTKSNKNIPLVYSLHVW